ncbi:hypothetical protein NIES592_21125 [Fischerella major NIES-592]|uniref:Uncharacterized protein n=1 Tax=Fischerella major NIES-592 TaxID=210994 RepID=A0A1U7GU52_9CYAN|nr:hypothetical protein NIES592_21125 [Fischerella major NIES-592]
MPFTLSFKRHVVLNEETFKGKLAYLSPTFCMNFDGGVKDEVVIGSQEGNFFICLKTPSKVLS